MMLPRYPDETNDEWAKRVTESGEYDRAYQIAFNEIDPHAKLMRDKYGPDWRNPFAAVEYRIQRERRNKLAAIKLLIVIAVVVSIGLALLIKWWVH
jgi:hypothetical protein